MFSSQLDDALQHANSLLSQGFLADLDSSLFPLSADDAVRLLRLPPDSQPDAFERLRLAASTLRERLFHGSVSLITPLYVTSFCKEHCTYCNYRARNRLNVTRYRLSDAELESEAGYLIHKGIRILELVYATDPAFRPPAIARHIRLVKRSLDKVGGGIVGLNAEPFDENDYSRLVDAGLDFVVLWQETYDRESYRLVHPGGTKKSSFDYRLDAYERMLRGGIRKVGLGVLSGLSEWRRDWAILFLHQEYLRARFGLDSLIVGLPRLKPAVGAKLQGTADVPSDRELLLCVYVQALYWPQAIPFVNTRETWAWCLSASAGGGVLFTLNCSTIPGGYTLGKHGYQFPSFDFDAEDHVLKLTKAGLVPHLSFPPLHE